MKKLIFVLILFISVFLISCFTKEYTVQFVDYDGTIIAEVVVKDGEAIVLPENPTREDYKFLGWDKDFTNITSDLIANAVYEKVVFSITFKDDDSETIVKVNKNGKLTPLDEEKYQKEKFLGWYLNDELFDFNTNIIEDFTLEARWKEKDAIYIGVSCPLTTSFSVYGLMVKKGIELAVEEINNNGGIIIKGVNYKLEIVEFYDDHANAFDAGESVEKFIELDADMIIGSVTNEATEGLILEAIKVGIPVITPTAAADHLTVGEDGTKRDERLNIFRTCYNDTYQAKYMANFAYEKGYKKIYVLFNENEEYSIGLKDTFVKEMQNKSINVTVDSFDPTIVNFDIFALDIINGEYDCVYLPLYQHKVNEILTSLFEYGYNGTVLGCDGWDGLLHCIDSRYYSNPNYHKFLEKCFYTTNYFNASENENVKKFVESYKVKYNENPTMFAALAYDTVYIAKQAIEQAQSYKYSNIINILRVGTFNNLVTSKNNLSYDYNGNPLKDCYIISYKDGKVVEAN